MQIRYGFDIEVQLFQPTTLVTLMDVHPTQSHAVIIQSPFANSQGVPIETFIDSSGNLSRRLTAQPGPLALRLEGIAFDDGKTDEVDWDARVIETALLPTDALPFLMASRYCETDLLAGFAWSNFGHIHGGWAKVQAICDFVHGHLTFSYPNARPTRTASDAMRERSGVCRDFTHLAITLCRCLNIPARYCNGYLGDIGVPFDPAPMDFNAWFEVFLGGRWYTFDARHNQPRIGRILIARGRDATDIAMITSFGPHALNRFDVTTEEVQPHAHSLAA